MNFRSGCVVVVTSLFIGLAACNASSTDADDRSSRSGTTGSSSHDEDGSVATSSGGGGSSSSSGGGGSSSSSGSASSDLACSSLAFCTTNKVKTFLGGGSVPAGGSLVDGLYRLSWKIARSTNPDRVGYFDDVGAILFQDGQFVQTNSIGGESRGTMVASGSFLVFTTTHGCRLGVDGDLTSDTVTWRYSATADELVLFDYSDSAYDLAGVEMVFQRIDPSQASSLCETISTTPQTPGTSMQCSGSTCACTAKLGGTIDASTCE